MVDFSGLGGVQQGFQQGQINEQTLKMRAQQIMAADQALQQEKQKLSAAAAAFKGLSDQTGAPPQGGQGQGGQGPIQGPPQMPPQQGPQPPMPGQPSVPMQRPGMPQGQPGGGGMPMPPQGGQQQPPQPGMPQPQPGQQPGQGGGQGQPQAMQILGALAQQIKKANPGLDDATLMDALQQQIGLMKGVQPELKDQMTMMLTQAKMDMQGQLNQSKLDNALEIAHLRADGAGDRSDQAGWQILQDSEGKNYRYNTRTSQATDLSGKPIEIPGSGMGKMGSGGGVKFTDEQGALMAALAEKGVSLPTGFRSKEQQATLYKGLLERNKGKTPDEIADGIAKGQIKFGAEKKETQTAAAQAGKIGIAQNELQEFIPLVRQAAKDIPQGQFVPLNKLMNLKDEQISNPKLRALKVRITSVLNAYDQLAARGGTDKDKRAQAHALLMTADSPEVLEAALSSFELEAQAAERAAQKATQVNGGRDAAPAAGGAGGGNDPLGIR